MPDSIRDNPERNRFELDVGGEVAFASYRRAAGVITLTHTEVPHALRGRGFGSRLARGVLEHVRGRGLRVVPACGFVAAFIDAHTEFADLLASSPRAAARDERRRTTRRWNTRISMHVSTRR